MATWFTIHLPADAGGYNSELAEAFLTRMAELQGARGSATACLLVDRKTAATSVRHYLRFDDPESFQELLESYGAVECDHPRQITLQHVAGAPLAPER